MVYSPLLKEGGVRRPYRQTVCSSIGLFCNASIRLPHAWRGYFLALVWRSYAWTALNLVALFQRVYQVHY